MMVAANQGHKGVVKMLIDAGADVTVKDEVSFLLCVGGNSLPNNPMIFIL